MKRLLPSLILLLLTACATPPSAFSGSMFWTMMSSKRGEAREAYIQEALTRDLITDRHIDHIRNRRILGGMTENEVRAAWGNPTRINETVIPGRLVRRQMVYARSHGNNYVYLENGLVTAWQTSR